MSTTLAPLILSGWTKIALLKLLGFALMASIVASAFAFAHRSYSTRLVPRGTGPLLGLGAVVVPLSMQAVTNSTVIGGTALQSPGSASFLLGVFLTAVVSGDIGRRIGDHIARDVFDIVHVRATGEVGTLLQSAELVTTVELPTEIEDLDGYSTVGEATKRELAGRQMVFPNRLSDDALESRLRSRLVADFDIDAIHVSLEENRDIESLAVGRQPRGLGPLLPPRTVAVAVEGDPPPDCGTGDPIELWTTGQESSELAVVGTIHTTAGDVTTLTIGNGNSDDVIPGETYRILTRAENASDLYKLVATLWDTHGTVLSETIEEGGALHGEFVDWVPVSVLLIERDGERIPFPENNETLEPGDTVHVLGVPEGLHRFRDYEPQREPGKRPPNLDGDNGQNEGSAGRLLDWLLPS